MPPVRDPSVAAAGILLVCLAACGSSTPSPSPPPTAGASATPRPQYVAPIGALTHAELDVENGASTITVSGADLGDDLYHAEIAQAGATLVVGQDPTGVVQVRTGRAGTGPAHLRIGISTHVPWTVRINGGTHLTLLDLRDVRVAGVRVAAGATELTLYLPKPQGEVPVVLTGGETTLVIHVATGAATQLELGAGAHSVTVEGHTDTGGQPHTYTSDGYAAATDRYRIRSLSGASTVRFERSSP